MTEIWGVIRTKGQAPYLKQVIEAVQKYLDGIVLIDNNQKPIHFQKFNGVKYCHYDKAVAPMGSTDHRLYYERSIDDDPNSLAGFYDYSFSQVPKGSWKLKLDDDDLWAKHKIASLRSILNNKSKNSIVYFSGINYLGKGNLSSHTPICGGRDHFVIGPECDYKFINDELWEHLVVSPRAKKYYIGITYLHLKFFGLSVGYEKDYDLTNIDYLRKINENNFKPLSYENYTINPIDWLRHKCSWRLVGNNLLGAPELKKFIREVYPTLKSIIDDY